MCLQYRTRNNFQLRRTLQERLLPNDGSRFCECSYNRRSVQIGCCNEIAHQPKRLGLSNNQEKIIYNNCLFDGPKSLIGSYFYFICCNFLKSGLFVFVILIIIGVCHCFSIFCFPSCCKL